MAERDLPQPTDAVPADDAAAKLDLRRAADFMGISVQRLNRLRRRGEIPAQRVGWRGWSFLQSDLMAYVERSAGVAGAAAEPQPSSPRALSSESFLQMVAALMSEPAADTQATAKPAASKAAVEEAPLVRMANAILSTAIDQNATDLHIEPDRLHIRVRIRVDGQMAHLMLIPKHVQAALINRYKVIADVAVHKRNIPQLGHIPIRHGDQAYNLRVSVMPSMYGETVVFHMLRLDNLVPLAELGMSEEVRAALDGVLWSPSGLLLLVGPSGSGLTTTAACLLNRMNHVGNNLCSFEELPEYRLLGTTQTYRCGLRGTPKAEVVQALLRQSPRTLFLGDIQDAESARIAVDAAQSGTLAIATIAGLDTLDGVRRLISLGIDREEVARALAGVCAQRLVRRICPECRVPQEYPDYFSGFDLTQSRNGNTISLYRGEGCEACRKSGFRGRVGLFEIQPFSDGLADAIASGASLPDLLHAAGNSGRLGFRAQASPKIVEGITTLEEAQRALHRVR